ncbi:PQQ-dependent sugar dehydrogenase [Streptomyces sp. NPDC057740]|uniref:PQQ-dependent sugar dehydrogenase n=1 Tax=Streptomyces sp. NPDC057740 TaxID=3346234 RepID=UPI0036751615
MSLVAMHRVRPKTAAVTAVTAAVVAFGVIQSPGAGAAVPDEGAEPSGISRLSDQLTVPWGISFLPGRAAALVTERNTGVVWKVGLDGTKKRVGSVPNAVWSKATQDKGGLLGVAASPTWNGTTDKAVFFMETTAVDNRVVRMNFDGTRLSGYTPVLTGIVRDTQHNGGTIAFGPDRYLYVATGDAQQSRLAQKKNSLNGKILRITKTGAAAPGNPFGNRVYSYGHRNPQGLAWDRAGRLWETEIGLSTWDELNLVKPGKNYGWPSCEGSCSTGGMTNPKFVWSPDEGGVPAQIAIADNVIYASTLSGQRLWRLPLNSTGESVGRPTAYFKGSYGRLRALAKVPGTNQLWLGTSDRGPAKDLILKVPLK